ncbi:hypothetical protein A2160_00155 [Candidatus Beckwithbacteria bacterium RBG_13_42_9]|uniref:ABC transporter permease n=1 Tax=Candidatus Beckwithbacteria bacterium RBG_13_42_9 TaxID=1797457 RepID=A0A1F5E576_9BACT|nr:MAG: hypothetical protein A2160_00155 [Candidatus Beckwithbacteria bacterium RBG_13_42_9]
MFSRKYLFVWLKTSTLSLESVFSTKGSSLMYLLGKFIRFFFFLWLLLRLGDQIQKVSGFTVNQLIIFFLVFNLFDMFGQIFFRGVYWFRQDVINGQFDFALLRPMSALFQVLTAQTDLLDVPLFVIVVAALIKEGISVPLTMWFLFAFMGMISFVLITAVHIFAAALCVLTTEVDHTMMIYRDLSAMARLPVDIYAPLIRILLTLVLPVAVALTFPAKALMGLLGWPYVLFALIISLIFLMASFKLWQYSLSQHTSSSS